jgi:hypothetical protein
MCPDKRIIAAMVTATFHIDYPDQDLRGGMVSFEVPSSVAESATAAHNRFVSAIAAGEFIRLEDPSGDEWWIAPETIVAVIVREANCRRDARFTLIG